MRCPTCDKPMFPRRPLTPKDRAIVRRQLPDLYGGPMLVAHLAAEHGLSDTGNRATRHQEAHSDQRFILGREHDHTVEPE